LKRGVTLLICLAALGGLIGAYFYLGGHPVGTAAVSPTPVPNKMVDLINKQKWDVKSISYTANGNNITILPQLLPTPTPYPTMAPQKGATPTPSPSASPTPTQTPTPNIGFSVSGYESSVLNQSNVDDMARMAYSLSASEKISDNGSPKDFGLDPPAAEINAKYADGTEKTIYVGMQTPSHDNYYIMIKGDPAIYMLTSSTGARAFYTADDIVDKTLPAISADTLEYVFIKEKGKDPVEFKYDGTQEKMDQDMKQYGGVQLVMSSPYKGWQLYNSNFKTNVLDGMNGISIGNLVADKPPDYAKYGLDDPSLTVWLKDANGEIHLDIGNDADPADVKNTDTTAAATATADTKTYVYVKFADRPAVYVMDKSYITSLYNLNIFGFTQRFIELANIDTVDSIAIKSAATNYDVQLNHEYIPVTATPTATPTPSPDPNAAPQSETPSPPPQGTTPAPTPTPENVIHPALNGKQVQDKAFRTFYQAVIGLSYDTVIDTYTPTDQPEVTISYKFNNGDPDAVIKFFKYNNDFYAVQKNDDPIQFVISKQYVDSMFQSAVDLLAGKLDKSS